MRRNQTFWGSRLIPAVDFDKHHQSNEATHNFLSPFHEYDCGEVFGPKIPPLIQSSLAKYICCYWEISETIHLRFYYVVDHIWVVSSWYPGNDHIICWWLSGVALVLCQADPVLNDGQSGNDESRKSVLEGVRRKIIEKVVRDHEDENDDGYSSD